MQIFLLVMVAVSLSMDAFSLSLAYGTLNLEKRNILMLSVIVGMYHFFMPIIGLLVGNTLMHFININPNLIVMVVLVFIGIEMIIESFKKEEKIKSLNYLEMLIFGFAVSVDSFSVGIGLKAMHISPIICSLVFSFFSFLFTYIGLFFGKTLSLIIGKIATFIGGITLIVIGVFYIL